MLNSLKKLWQEAVESPASGRKAHSLELCVAALMIEIMRVDGKIEAAEQQQVLQQLQQSFDLSDQATRNLLGEARLATDKAMDMHQFTSRIVKGFSTDERLNILQQLWRVAMADGHVDPYEEQLLRRVADLLGIHHRSYIKAKLIASEAASGADSSESEA